MHDFAIFRYGFTLKWLKLLVKSYLHPFQVVNQLLLWIESS